MAKFWRQVGLQGWSLGEDTTSISKTDLLQETAESINRVGGALVKTCKKVQKTAEAEEEGTKE